MKTYWFLFLQSIEFLTFDSCHRLILERVLQNKCFHKTWDYFRSDKIIPWEIFSIEFHENQIFHCPTERIVALVRSDDRSSLVNAGFGRSTNSTNFKYELIGKSSFDERNFLFLPFRLERETKFKEIKKLFRTSSIEKCFRWRTDCKFGFQPMETSNKTKLWKEKIDRWNADDRW